jgi:hypothetical protein
LAGVGLGEDEEEAQEEDGREQRESVALESVRHVVAEEGYRHLRHDDDGEGQAERKRRELQQGEQSLERKCAAHAIDDEPPDARSDALQARWN